MSAASPAARDLDSAVGGLRLTEFHSFVVLAEELHYRRAAVQLGLTPGGLSRRIAHLERALGTRLLQRTTRSVGLTPCGRQFLITARQLLDGLADAPAGKPPLKHAG